MVRLYVMTKMDGGCLNECSLALFAVMSQNFILLNLVNFDVVVYMTHSVTVINERKSDNLVLNQHTIPYIDVVG